MKWTVRGALCERVVSGFNESESDPGGDSLLRAPRTRWRTPRFLFSPISAPFTKDLLQPGRECVSISCPTTVCPPARPVGGPREKGCSPLVAHLMRTSVGSCRALNCAEDADCQPLLAHLSCEAGRRVTDPPEASTDSQKRKPAILPCHGSNSVPNADLGWG